MKVKEVKILPNMTCIECGEKGQIFYKTVEINQRKSTKKMFSGFSIMRDHYWRINQG